MFSMKKSLVIISIFVIAATLLLGCNKAEQTNESENQGKETTMQPPAMKIDTEKSYTANMATSMGEITLKLFPKKAPKTVNNFVSLAEKGFYDGTIFHRVIPDFMIQGGDPEGTGTGGPGYQFEDEINDVKLVKGKLAMANAGPNTNGSQFFIVTADETSWLDGKHTVFGEVTKGMDVVMKIQSAERDQSDKPLEDITLEKVTVKEE